MITITTVIFTILAIVVLSGRDVIFKMTTLRNKSWRSSCWMIIGLLTFVASVYVILKPLARSFTEKGLGYYAFIFVAYWLGIIVFSLFLSWLIAKIFPSLAREKDKEDTDKN